MAAFVTFLLLSNVLGAGKRAVVDLPWIGEWPFGAGILFFPISYIVGDVLTEVYGYRRTRRCIWAGFAATLSMDLMSFVAVKLPSVAAWDGQGATEAVFGPLQRLSQVSVDACWEAAFAPRFVSGTLSIWQVGTIRCQ